MGGPTGAGARPRPVGKQIACLRVPRAEAAAAAASRRGRWSVASGQPGKAAVRTPRHSPESSDVLCRSQSRRLQRGGRAWGGLLFPLPRAHLPRPARACPGPAVRCVPACLLVALPCIPFPGPPGPLCCVPANALDWLGLQACLRSLTPLPRAIHSWGSPRRALLGVILQKSLLSPLPPIPFFSPSGAFPKPCSLCRRALADLGTQTKG